MPGHLEHTPQNTTSMYWLIKSEPFVFSYDDLERDGVTTWDGVRNYQARNNLRAMKLDDYCLFYHSNEGLAVVAIARVSKEAVPEITEDKGDWSVVEVVPHQRLARPVTLKEIKAHPELANIGMIKFPRLSVISLTEAEFNTIIDLSNTPA